MTFLFTWWKLVLGVALGVALAYLPFVSYGKSLGRSDLVRELQEDRAKILKNGKEVDETVYTADTAALCLLLGGCLPNEGQPDKPM